MRAFYWVGIIIVILIIAGCIWLLAVGGGTITDSKGKLNAPCTGTGDCNCGMVCSISGGTQGVCKVSYGGVCESNADCANGFSCQNGVCLGQSGGLNRPCPCGEGFTCVSNVCKVTIGGKCTNNLDCANSVCMLGVCTHPIVAAAQAAGITDLTQITQNKNTRCRDKNCDCDRYKSSDQYCDDSKYYYSDSDSCDNSRKNHCELSSDSKKSSSSDSKKSSSSDSKKSSSSDSKKSWSSKERSRTKSKNNSHSSSSSQVKPCYVSHNYTSSQNESSGKSTYTVSSESSDCKRK